MVRQLALVIAFVVGAAESSTAPGAVPVRVVVHAGNPVTSISRAELSAIFMKRVGTWPDGAQIVPVEPPATSPARERFARAVHGKSLAFVTRYWHRLIFSGRGIPPREMRSEQALLELVREERRAIGYVDGNAELPEGVKVVAVRP